MLQASRKKNWQRCDPSSQSHSKLIKFEFQFLRNMVLGELMLDVINIYDLLLETSTTFYLVGTRLKSLAFYVRAFKIMIRNEFL